MRLVSEIFLSQSQMSRRRDSCWRGLAAESHQTVRWWLIKAGFGDTAGGLGGQMIGAHQTRRTVGDNEQNAKAC